MERKGKMMKEDAIRKNLDELEDILNGFNASAGKSRLEVRVCRIRQELSLSACRGASNTTNMGMHFWERKFREEAIGG